MSARPVMDAVLRPSMRGACVLAAWCGMAGVALAQQQPYPAMFGGAAALSSGRQSLDATFSLSEAYDTDVLGRDTGAILRPAFQIGGLFTGFEADGRYALRGRHAQLNATGGTNLRYFPKLGQIAAYGHYGMVDAGFQMGRSTTLVLSQSLSYTPSYLYGLFAQPQGLGGPAAAANSATGPAPDYALTTRRSYASTSTARLTREMGRRVTLDFSGGYRLTRFSGVNNIRPDISSSLVDGHVRYGMTRDLALRFGYGYRQAVYSTGVKPHEHIIDLGADYNRALSRSRRTYLTFSFGSSVFEGPVAGNPNPNAVARQLRAFGNAELTHQTGRTWLTRATYRRGGQFVEGLATPVYSDSLTVTVDGFFTRKTDFTALVAYANGDLLGRTGASFETYTANARVRRALGRKLALFSEYLYYFYNFTPGVQLTTGIPPQVRRHGVRVGISYWLPVLGK